MLTRIRLVIEKLATFLGVFFLLSLVILAFLQVILRNFFSVGFNAVEELMRNGVLWIAFSGAILTTLRGKHIAIDIIPRVLSRRYQRVLNAIINLTAALICFILSWLSVQFLRLEINMNSTVAAHIPAWLVELIIPVGFFLLAISFFLKIFDKPETMGH